MALARYTDTFWFPSGGLAFNVPARVFPVSSTTLAPLWADAAGTVPLPNPLDTSDFGVLDFWAESGDYWVHLDSETFPVTVGMSQEQADLSTGVASGGLITVNGANPLAVDITAVDGYVVDFTAGTQAQPGVTRVKTPDSTVPLDAASLARTVTWWLLDAAGNFIQQGTKPDAVQRRTHIVLGVTAQAGGTLIVTKSLPVILQQPANQVADFMDSLGPFVIDGNKVTANGANLSINQSSGTMFSRAFNRYVGTTLTQNPHVHTTFAQSPCQFRYITSTGTVFGPLVTTIDVANYDVGGVITPLGGGSNTSSIHRVWLFATDAAPTQLAIQYGTTSYASLSAAINALGSGTHLVNPLIEGNGALIAWVVAIRTATNLSDQTQAAIVTPGKFAIP
jgi:hypothetical protein